MRWIMERQLEYGKVVQYASLITARHLIVHINYELLWKTLLEMGIPKHLIQLHVLSLLKRLYEDQSAVIRTEFGDTDRFKIKKEKDRVASCPHSCSTCTQRG